MRISDYEKESGEQVKKIAFMSDNVPVRDYEGIKHTIRDMNAHVLAVGWARGSAIRYYSGREFEQIEPPEEMVRFFAGKNWDYYKPEEQIIFDGDTVYIVIY